MSTDFPMHQRKKPTWRTPCFQGAHHVGLQTILPLGPPRTAISLVFRILLRGG